jgi:uncharacterized Ntn-hydrolase superfamily protein
VVTFSIVARSEDGRSLGVAVASKFLAVGSAVPAAAADVGAIATQAHANLAYRRDGLRLLAEGRGAAATLAALVEGDDARDTRQAGVVDAGGGSATFTGTACSPWAGGRTGPGYAVQGNILTGPEVVESMERAWAQGSGLRMAQRLLAALTAGDAAGGDRRGRQSAALYVVRKEAGYGGGDDVEMDLRVDDHSDPVPELRRLLDLHDLYFGTPDEAALLPLEGEVGEEVRRRLASLGYENASLDAALADWAGVENFEERVRPGVIDPLVLDQLRAR